MAQHALPAPRNRNIPPAIPEALPTAREGQRGVCELAWYLDALSTNLGDGAERRRKYDTIQLLLLQGVFLCRNLAIENKRWRSSSLLRIWVLGPNPPRGFNAVQIMCCDHRHFACLCFSGQISLELTPPGRRVFPWSFHPHRESESSRPVFRHVKSGEGLLALDNRSHPPTPPRPLNSKHVSTQTQPPPVYAFLASLTR